MSVLRSYSTCLTDYCSRLANILEKDKRSEKYGIYPRQSVLPSDVVSWFLAGQIGDTSILCQLRPRYNHDSENTLPGFSVEIGWIRIVACIQPQLPGVPNGRRVE